MIDFRNITKKYRDKTVLHNLNFTIPEGKIVVLIGPSGCGKTTTLKMINRLIRPTKGTIFIKGEDVEKQNVIRLRRNIGYVIQQTGLFPHMTVKENIEIIPRLEKLPSHDIDRRTGELMDMVGLNRSLLHSYTHRLSGGQQQRVGVARAFALDPDIILMDEPFSAVDPITKSQLQDELLNIQSQVRKTVVFVTHDINEAVKIGDLICIMKAGGIVQYDAPENIMKNPADDFVAEFVGKSRIWQSPEFIKAADIMDPNPVTTYPGATIFRVKEKLRENRVESMAVVDRNDKLQGVVSIRTILRHSDQQAPVSDVMNKDCKKVSPHDSIADILKLVKDYKFLIIPVVDEHNVLQGVVSNSSLVMVLSKQFLDEEQEAEL